jgi:hypothetical protein
VYRFEAGNFSNVKGVGEGYSSEESTSALGIASTSGRMGKAS